MFLTAKARPIIASALAGAVACWPIFLAAASEVLTSYGLLTRAEWGDDLFIGINLACLLYPIACVCSFMAGQGVVWAGATKVRTFIFTSSVAALLISLFFFAGQAFSSHFSLMGGILIFSGIFAAMLFSFIPAAFFWWYIAVRPVRLNLETKTCRLAEY